MSQKENKSIILIYVNIIMSLFLVLFLSFFGGIPYGPHYIDTYKSRPRNCIPLSKSSAFAWPPVVIYGISPNFRNLVLAAFPIGSCESNLVEWMNYMGFGEARKSDYESHFPEDAQSLRRSAIRRSTNSSLTLRGLSRNAPVGRSIFSIAWRTDDAGRLSEIYADTEHFHFELP
ncbi:hypothetical protein [Agrobacterium sp. NPDC089420]|uniref:hypothetical protein n=1 Tax=Agrobacterium sp. NPDC089420 TaxID=3363918 RepID=UPI00384DF8C5